MAANISEAFLSAAQRLLDLGLSYLSLDRASSTLSTGERQRMQLARAVRNRTTGVLYVLDEPSIGLHPSNIVGLNNVMHEKNRHPVVLNACCELHISDFLIICSSVRDREADRSEAQRGAAWNQ